MPKTPRPPSPPAQVNFVWASIMICSLMLLIFVATVQMYFAQKGRDHLESLRTTHMSALETRPPASYPDAPMDDPAAASIIALFPAAPAKELEKDSCELGE
jgi:hypothetical protein